MPANDAGRRCRNRPAGWRVVRPRSALLIFDLANQPSGTPAVLALLIAGQAAITLHEYLFGGIHQPEQATRVLSGLPTDSSSSAADAGSYRELVAEIAKLREPIETLGARLSDREAALAKRVATTMLKLLRIHKWNRCGCINRS